MAAQGDDALHARGVGASRRYRQSAHADPHYVQYLVRLRGLHTAVEGRLDTFDFTPFGFDYRGWHRSRLIEDDLACLGCPREWLTEQRSPPAPVLSSADEALGCVYVVEGSAIGARAILPQIERRLGLTPGSRALRFLPALARRERCCGGRVSPPLTASIRPQRAPIGSSMARHRRSLLFCRWLPPPRRQNDSSIRRVDLTEIRMPLTMSSAPFKRAHEEDMPLGGRRRKIARVAPAPQLGS